ncbi:MAG: HTTM domain-containing protein [Myxococcales bacterium]
MTPACGASWLARLRVRGPLWPLALFRIGFGLALLVQTLVEAGRHAAYAPERFHLPLVPLLAAPSAPVFAMLIRLALLSAIATILGAGSRIAVVVLTLVHGYLFAVDSLLFRNHVYAALLLGGLLALSPCGQVLSFDALMRRMRRRPPRPREGSLVVAQLIKGQVWIIYLWSALNKLRPSFLDGWVFQQELPALLREGLLARWLNDRGTSAMWVILDDDARTAALAWSVLLVELFIAVGIMHRRLRPWACACGLTLHVGIFLSMNVFTFGCLLVASYPLFLASPRSPPLTACTAKARADSTRAPVPALPTVPRP